MDNCTDRDSSPFLSKVIKNLFEFFATCEKKLLIFIELKETLRELIALAVSAFSARDVVIDIST